MLARPTCLAVAALLLLTSCGTNGPGPEEETPDAGTSPTELAADSCVISPNFPPDQAVQGKTNQGELWAMPAGRWEPVVDENFQISIRVTGEGEFSVMAVGPDGEQLEPRIGPVRQFGTTEEFNRPGEEWEMFFQFDQPGCWYLDVTRGELEGTINFEVEPATESSA